MISLQKLCINLIAQEFERFHIALTKSNNEKYKRNFEFLQIKYSSELGSEIFKRRKLKEKYLGFIINKHLKFLDEQWVYETCFYRNAMEDIFRRLPNLTKIFCMQVTDGILENIAKFCPKIVEIDGIFSSVTDRGVKYLCENKNGIFPCPDLKKLYIICCDVTDDSLAYLLRNLRSVEELDHERIPSALYSLHKNDLPKLENVPSYNIVKVSIFNETHKPYYNDLLKIFLTVCPKLKSLPLFITDKEQLTYINHTYLERLEIWFRELREKINIDNFLNNCGRNLLILSVDHCILSISQLVISCPKLQNLSLIDVTFTDDHDDSKVDFHSLVSCRFHTFEMNRDNVKAMNLLLLSSPKLKYVIFYYCDLTPDSKISILKCCETRPLEIIEFYNNVVELSFAKDILMRCPSLKRLQLHYCRHTLQEKRELKQFGKTLSNKPRIGYF